MDMYENCPRNSWPYKRGDFPSRILTDNEKVDIDDWSADRYHDCSYPSMKFVHVIVNFCYVRLFECSWIFCLFSVIL